VVRIRPNDNDGDDGGDDDDEMKARVMWED
jgi:hypothetical protein